MEKGYHKGQELTMSDLGLCLEELSNQPLELFAREEARLVLAVALEEEVAGFLQRRRYERSRGSRPGYRNGHRGRQVSCGAGEVEVAMPRVPDTEQGFHSQLLEAWLRRSKLLEETIPLLCVEGLSTRDFKRALKPLWGKSGLSRSSISRANKALKEAFNNWKKILNNDFRSLQMELERIRRMTRLRQGETNSDFVTGEGSDQTEYRLGGPEHGNGTRGEMGGPGEEERSGSSLLPGDEKGGPSKVSERKHKQLTFRVEY